MQRISGSTTTTDAQGRRAFRDDDPDNAILGTIVSANWLNTVQEELCAIIEKSGGTLDAANTSQLYDILLGRQNDVPALADFRAVEGDGVPDTPPLAVCSSPAGLIVSHAQSIGLLRGGRWLTIFSPINPAASWACLAAFDGAVLEARLITEANSGNVVLKIRRIGIGNTTYTGVSGGVPFVGVIDVDIYGVVGVDHLIYNLTASPHVTKTFLWGDFADAQHFIYVLRVVDDEAGIDKLEIHAVWVEADVNIDVTAHTITLSQSGALTLPNSTHLLGRITGGRLSHGARTFGVVVCPTNILSFADSLRAFAVLCDDDALTATAVTSGSFAITGGKEEGYTYPVGLVSLGGARALVWLRNVNFYALISDDGHIPTLTLSADPHTGSLQGDLIAACESPGGGAFLFCKAGAAGSGLLAVHHVSQSGVVTLSLTTPCADIAARSLSALKIDRCMALRGIAEEKIYARLGRAVASEKGAALYLPGLALTTTSPQWGPWTARTIDCNTAGTLGCDANGRAFTAILGTIGGAAQKLMLAASGLP